MTSPEFIALRDRTLREVRLRPDPMDLALHYADDLADEDLRAVIGDRLDALKARLTAWRHQRTQAEPYLRGLEPMTFDHTTARLKAEIAWHESLLEQLPKPRATGDDPAKGPHVSHSPTRPS